MAEVKLVRHLWSLAQTRGLSFPCGRDTPFLSARESNMFLSFCNSAWVRKLDILKNIGRKGAEKAENYYGKVI